MSKHSREMLATNGAPAAQVAAVVYRAVLDDRFFVFPTAERHGMTESRVAEIRPGCAWRDAPMPEMHADECQRRDAGRPSSEQIESSSW